MKLPVERRKDPSIHEAEVKLAATYDQLVGYLNQVKHLPILSAFLQFFPLNMHLTKIAVFLSEDDSSAPGTP